MDYSSRERYRARRRAIIARRQKTLAGALVVLVVLVGLAWLVWPSGATAPATTAALPASAVTPAVVIAATVQPSAPAVFFHDQRLTYEPDFYVPEVQAFLDSQPGPLKDFSAEVGSRRHSFAEIVVGQSLYYSLNPRVVLALLESQGMLLSDTSPTQAQLDWALGYRTKDAKPDEDKLRGLTAQVRWAVRQLLYARRDFNSYPPLTYADGTQAAAPAGWELGQYALARALAPATTPAKLGERMQAFATTYTRLFGDPRSAPTGWPGPSVPFLAWPMTRPARITSFFDHDAPFLSRNGGIFSYWGRNETDLSYDGHDGWDYAAAPPDPALAAAAGTVVFAGNADDNCATTAVVIDHGNGYRTLYWHLSSADVAIGQQVAAGDAVGIIGASGCAFGAHLHLGVQYLGRNTDPYGYCGSIADPWAANPSGVASRWLWNDRPSPCGPPPPGAIVVDTDATDFDTTGVWQQAALGYGGSALYARSVGTPGQTTPTGTAPAATAIATATATYSPRLPAAGRYRVLAYVPYVLNGFDDAVGVTYRITHSGGVTTLQADLQLHANEWLDLGSYDFDAANAALTLDNRADTADQSVWVDAIMWLPQ